MAIFPAPSEEYAYGVQSTTARRRVRTKGAPEIPDDRAFDGRDLAMIIRHVHVGRLVLDACRGGIRRRAAHLHVCMAEQPHNADGRHTC
jgi:hypothetical protein